MKAMAHHYVVTAHKPTAVTACVTGIVKKIDSNSPISPFSKFPDFSGKVMFRE